MRNSETGGISRRQVLTGMAAGAAAAAAGRMFPQVVRGMPQAATTSMPATEGKVKRAVAAAVLPFDLTEVRLLEGPFLVAALEYAGEHEGEASFAMSLASAGEVKFEAIA